MQNNTLTFNTRFNDLHRIITKLLDTSEKRDFYSCLSEIRDRAEHSPLFDRINDQYWEDLRTMSSIRNILIHKNDWIAIPAPTIARLEGLIAGITRIEESFHKRAIDVFGKKIQTAKDSDTLADLVNMMASRNFSHVPVYDEKGKFRGVFSLKSLVFWINKEKFLIDKNIKVADVTIDTKNSEYLFIRSDTAVSEIEGFFREYSKNRKKLWAIFLTKSGTTKDTIEGIITAWDMPMIYEQTNA